MIFEKTLLMIAFALIGLYVIVRYYKIKFIHKKKRILIREHKDLVKEIRQMTNIELRSKEGVKLMRKVKDVKLELMKMPNL